MRKLLIAAAFGLALPTVAHAQDAPAMACCEKMANGEGCDCCKDEAGHEGHDGHAEQPAEAQPHSH